MRWRAEAALPAMLLAGCAGGEPAGGPYEPAPAVSYEEVGMAGWYGEELAGRRTANGERFDPSGMTAAHRTLPMSSWAEVTAMNSGKSVRVRINDRGPYHGRRIIDLSRAAAQRLGISGVGTVRVRSVARGEEVGARERLRPVPDADRDGDHFVQIASFSSKPRAKALADRLDADLIESGDLWRVRLGPYRNRERAEQARAAVAAQGFGDARIDFDD